MKFLKKWYAILAWAVASITPVSCGMMEDNRDYCPAGLYVSFKYDYNLQRADLFRDHVGSVTLYVFDEKGKLVKTQEESNTPASAPLRLPGYHMHVTGLTPGKYQFLVLAGQKSYAEMLDAKRARFLRTVPAAGEAMEKLSVSLERQATAEGRFEVVNHSQPLDTLWHGSQLQTVEVYAEKPAYTTVSLMRNTKKINITLRELDDPTRMDVANYDMKIYDRNAVIRWDNSVDETDAVVYSPHAQWNTVDRTPVLLPSGKPSETYGKMAHADFMTSRLIFHDEPAADGILSVTNRLTGVEVARLNLPDILSRLRTSEDLYRYSEQEFLDRGYDYKLDLFLIGDRLAYVNISISVLGWSKRIQFEDL